MQPGDMLVCVFINQPGVGETFDRWPLHVTLVPWFRLDIELSRFTEKLKEMLAPLKPFADTAGRREIFSKREANVLNKHKWQPLHEAVLACVYNTGEPAARQFRFVAEAYRPHVTVQVAQEVRYGDPITVSTVSVVEQKEDHKQVVGAISL